MSSVAGTKQDPTLKFQHVTIDGETYSLIYDFESIAMAESACGINLLLGIAFLLEQRTTAQQLRGLFYGALQKAHPSLSLEAVSRLIRPDTIPDIMNAVLMAHNDSCAPDGKFIKQNPSSAGEGAVPPVDQN